MLQIETIHLGTDNDPNVTTASRAEFHDEGSGVVAHAVISPLDVGRHATRAEASRALAGHLRRLADKLHDGDEVSVDTSDLDAMPEGARVDDGPSSGPSLGEPDDAGLPVIEGQGVRL